MRIAHLNGLAATLLLVVVSTSARGQSPPQAQPPASGALGSTLTLEQVKQKTERAPAPTEVSLEVLPATEPVPALKYRFIPALRQLRQGSALMHYSRAMLMFNQLPLELRRKVDAGPADPEPTAEDIQALLSSATPLFHELHQLALSEDFRWDHRIRDLRGASVWSYLLPDIQEGRSLMRLLRVRIDDQLARKDFDGAILSISDGYRLAEFMRSGETLIEQLVALAIAEMSRDAAQAAITTPGCPNLYWALASVPADGEPMRRAVEFELNSFENVFEMLGEAETPSGDEQYWQGRLQALLTTLRQLDFASDTLRFSITVAAMTASPQAKQQLIEAGWKKDEIDAMPPTRALLLNTRRELRYWADQLEKSSLLPYSMGAAVNQRVAQEVERWAVENRYRSLGAAIATVLYPSIDLARVALVRQRFQHDRLMVVEALRMHAADHQGQLPKSLEELHPVPAPLNPFTGQPFEYTAKAIDGGVSVELSGQLPSQYNVFKQLSVTFKNATLTP